VIVVPAIVVATTVLFVALCVASDVRTLRIPNALTGPAILIGVALNAWLSGWAGVTSSLAGFALATAILIVPFALGGIGGGDVKMMAAVGALLGPRLVLASLGIGFALGGLFMAVHLARRAQLAATLSRLGRMLSNAALTGSFEPLKVSAASPNAIALPYSLPLGLGTVGVIVRTMVGGS
jgi:prepilin peptidase CpaA